MRSHARIPKDYLLEDKRTTMTKHTSPFLLVSVLYPSTSLITPALRIVGNVVSGDDMQTQIVKDYLFSTQCIIDHQALPWFLNLLTNNFEYTIKKKICWTISNITAGNKEQIQAVVEVNIIAPLVHLLQNAEFDIKKEAAWAIKNATSMKTISYICLFLVSQGCINSLCDLLNCPDPRIVIVCFEGIENIIEE
ncbi:hypothetical protein Gogos_015581 [Gossypium gossypioides]|uniref:IBB domain-containing protein n=1 Tax=Gossypium gossypioides TaxID=34282 RepID=A0A7J9C247_GOSGO|nr:hypothetical protein [Gossypium gossypioides]